MCWLERENIAWHAELAGNSTALSERFRLNGHSGMGISRKQLHLPELELTKLVMDPVCMKVVPAGNLF